MSGVSSERVAVLKWPLLHDNQKDLPDIQQEDVFPAALNGAGQIALDSSAGSSASAVPKQQESVCMD